MHVHFGSNEVLFTAYRNKTIYRWDTVAAEATALNQQCQQSNTCVAPHDGELISNVAFGPFGLAINKAGDMLVSEANNRVWMVQAGTGKLKLVAGNGTRGAGHGSIIDPGNATNSAFSFIRGVDFGPGDSSFFFADQLNHRIVRVLLNCTIA